MRRPAWQAALAGLIVGLIIAVAVWQMPVGLALNSVFNGAVFALWPVMWIVVNALLLYNIAVHSGRFDAFRAWVLEHLPNDRRVVLVVIGFCFGALLEGIAGFGTPVAITSSLLILVGFPPLEALVFVLIFNTAPVAFGALGVPVTVLGAVTGLPATALGAMVGRQLPFMALILPFYVMALYGGWRSVRALWPVLLVAGGSFAARAVRDLQLHRLRADRRARLARLADRHAAVPAGLAAGARSGIRDRGCGAAQAERRRRRSPRLAGLAAVAHRLRRRDRLDHFKVFAIGAAEHSTGRGCTTRSRSRSITTSPMPRSGSSSRWRTGTAILLAAIITAVMVRLSPGAFFHCVARHLPPGLARSRHGDAHRRPRLSDELLRPRLHARPGVASTGYLFVLLSPFLGWVAVLLSGSDTSGNALFGNLQVVAARQLNLNPVLFAATNSSGGVMGKMISPQNIATGVSVTNLKGQEGVVFARTFRHSIVLTLLLGVLVAFQQYRHSLGHSGGGRLTRGLRWSYDRPAQVAKE